MSRGRKISEMLLPLREKPIQAYLGNGMHTLGLLRWILEQTGKADVWVSSYSTSEPFLNGFALMKAQGMVNQSMILLDQRASKKTLKLQNILVNAFDHVFMGQNHSKIILVLNGSYAVSVITSQNQTYGARAESTIVTTDKEVFRVLMSQFIDIAGTNSVELKFNNGNTISFAENRERGAAGSGTHERGGETFADAPLPGANWRPIGV